MLAAKRDLELPRILRKLDNFDLLVIDDLGYLPQGAEESEVLFTLIAERYERRSLGIASNLVFSEWEKVYANPMATAAAIDRIVHHSVILEFDVPSYRTNAAQNRRTEEGSDRPPAKMLDVDHSAPLAFALSIQCRREPTPCTVCPMGSPNAQQCERPLFTGAASTFFDVCWPAGGSCPVTSAWAQPAGGQRLQTG